MPVDEDYGRRQITLQQQQQQHASPSPVPPPQLQCPVGGCLPAASADHRYASDKNLLDPAERYAFGSERSNSDRLPSGERYQGVSERYPLGERPQTSVSSERLVPKEILQTSGHCQVEDNNTSRQYQAERYHYATCQRYPERYTPVQQQSNNVSSLDRYHNNAHTPIDRYSNATSSRTGTPTDRYHNLVEKDGKASSNDNRYDKYQNEIDRYHRSGSKSADIYKMSASSDRMAERYQHQQYQTRYDHHHQYVPDRFPAIPCPERFATNGHQQQDRVFTQVPSSSSYMAEPPSPAPASDRFVPPPPLSPDNTPSPDCYPNNAFPSPTGAVPQTDRFIPPPPLSPSPTDTKYSSPNKKDRYDKRAYQMSERNYRQQQSYYQQQQSNERYHGDRFVNGDRYIPPNAHMPVERYVPQQQEPYYNYQPYERYSSSSSTPSSTQKFNNSNGDPYMRRDLTYHYRLPLPYPSSNQYQRVRYSAHMGTPSRVKCCQYQDGYQLSKSSPGSTSSSSSITSQGKVDLISGKEQQGCNTSLQEMQCQSYQSGACTSAITYQQQQQEKGTQCGKECVGFVSPQLRGVVGNNVKVAGGQCRHSICASPSVEYVGASGGRHVCATPPPPRGSIGSADGSLLCNETCCTARRSQNSLTVAVW